MDTTGEDRSQFRVIGNYAVGPRIGAGSFAVVRRGWHRQSLTEVAVKEIDKKQLSHKKIGDNLLKEISILSNIRHPNIIRLFEAIETEDRIYLILEYCDGGDLAGYINRYGRVSETLARHFMRQLAAGLRVLNENCLIHRDLKPHNLLLSTNDEAPVLKIGDFGFARHLERHGLADTLCGSPLYMAPEIIQNKKYDGKADLWSAGAILYQLVIGKPPFEGDNQLQLFENILKSTELKFPEGAPEDMSNDFVALCRSLLRPNPVERLTFEEFFNHKFFVDPSNANITEKPSMLPCLVEQPECIVPQPALNLSIRDSGIAYLSGDDYDKRIYCKDQGSVSRTGALQESLPKVIHSVADMSLVDEPKSSKLKGLVDSIEKDYVLVNPHFASSGSFSYSLATSRLNNSNSGVISYPQKKIDQDIVAEVQVEESTTSTSSSAKPLASHKTASSSSTLLREVQRLSVLHPSARLQLLHQYVCALQELAIEKFRAGLLLESFSTELVVLAIWKKAIEVCSSWLSSIPDGDSPGESSSKESKLTPETTMSPADSPVESSSKESKLKPETTVSPADSPGESSSKESKVKPETTVSPADSPGESSSKESKLTPETTMSPSKSEEPVDFGLPQAVSTWAERGFLAAFGRAEKLSDHLQKMDGKAQMPDAMELIYETALEFGKSGGVDELMGRKDDAAAKYSKAVILLSFILGEAALLPLNPPFSLPPAEKKRIECYIVSFESRLKGS